MSSLRKWIIFWIVAFILFGILFGYVFWTRLGVHEPIIPEDDTMGLVPVEPGIIRTKRMVTTGTKQSLTA